MLIYKVTNLMQEKNYIGQTSSTLEKRWKRHISEAVHGRGFHLARAVRKYGTEAFDVEVLHICESKEEMDFAEIFYIQLLSTRAPTGYNLTDGGDGLLGRKHSEETRRKIGEGNKGKTRSEETLRRMSESKKGHITSEETKRKLREIAKTNGPNSSVFKKGHKSSEETLNKMRAAHKRRLPISEETRTKMSVSMKGKNKGRKHTPEQRRKQSDAQRGKKRKSPNVEALIRRNIAQTKTHCLRGHPRTPDNVGASYGCKACKILLQKIRQGRKHGDTVQV